MDAAMRSYMQLYAAMHIELYAAMCGYMPAAISVKPYAAACSDKRLYAATSSYMQLQACRYMRLCVAICIYTQLYAPICSHM